MSETTEVTTPSIVAATTITVLRTVKVGTEDSDGESELTETIEVHKFAVPPAIAKAGLSVRKSKQTVRGDWVAGEVTLGADRPCYMEELPQAAEVAYDLVKERMQVELPKMLAALDQLAKS